MGPKPKKKKAEKVVDPEVEKRENRRKEMIKEADKLQKSIQIEEQEAAKMKLSHFQLHRNWVGAAKYLACLLDCSNRTW